MRSTFSVSLIPSRNCLVPQLERKSPPSIHISYHFYHTSGFRLTLLFLQFEFSTKRCFYFKYEHLLTTSLVLPPFRSQLAAQPRPRPWDSQCPWAASPARRPPRHHLWPPHRPGRNAPRRSCRSPPRRDCQPRTETGREQVGMIRWWWFLLHHTHTIPWKVTVPLLSKKKCPKQSWKPFTLSVWKPKHLQVNDFMNPYLILPILDMRKWEFPWNFRYFTREQNFFIPSFFSDQDHDGLRSGILELEIFSSDPFDALSPCKLTWHACQEKMFCLNTDYPQRNPW